MEKPRKVHVLNGLQLPELVNQTILDKLKTLKLYPDDLCIASYPKTGSTWTQQIVRLIRNGGTQDDKIIAEAIPQLDVLNYYPKVDMDSLPRPRAFKTHFSYEHFPCGPPLSTPCRYIYVMRNPKDVAVSCYFYHKTTSYISADTTWEEFLKRYVAGDLIFGSYFDHILSWWPHRDGKKFLVVRYEDMKKDLRHAVSQIASFIDVDLPGDVVDRIVDLASFEKMKNDHTTNYSWVPLHDKEGATAFQRKGTVGDWRNYFTVEQSAQLDAVIAERFSGTGIEFEYD